MYSLKWFFSRFTPVSAHKLSYFWKPHKGQPIRRKYFGYFWIVQEQGGCIKGQYIWTQRINNLVWQTPISWFCTGVTLIWVITQSALSTQNKPNASCWKGHSSSCMQCKSVYCASHQKIFGLNRSQLFCRKSFSHVPTPYSWNDSHQASLKREFFPQLSAHTFSPLLIPEARYLSSSSTSVWPSYPHYWWI